MRKDVVSRMIIIGFPVFLQMLVQYIFSFTDMAFVGNYKPAGLSALTNAISPYFISLAFFFSIAQGLTILISNNIGAGKKNKAIMYAEKAFLFNELISLTYLLFWLLLGRQIIKLIGAKGEILEIASGYIRILCLSFISFGIGITSSAALQGMGRTLLVFIVILFKSTLNIFLNWALVFGKLGFPEFGINGSAIGSAISNILSDIILFLILNFQKDFQIRLEGIFSPDMGLLKDMVLLGLPIGIDGVLWQCGQTFLIVMLNHINQIYTGFVGVINNIVSLSFSFYWGAALSTLVLVSEYRGRGKMDVIRVVNRYGLIYSLIICTIFSFVIVSYPYSVFRVFMKDKNMIGELVRLVPFIVFIVFPKAINVILAQSIRGLGDTKWMMFNQLFGAFYISTLGYLLIHCYGLGIKGALISVALDEVTRGIVNVFRFYFFEKCRGFLKSRFT